MKKLVIIISLLILPIVISARKNIGVIEIKSTFADESQLIYLPITLKIDVEYAALMALYNSTKGPSWSISTGWSVGDPCDMAWYGVECDSGHVQRLNLGGNQLSGPIPAELGNLSSLEGLFLPRNGLSGSIPAELGNLNSLEWLSLSDNRLSGTIPAELGNLSGLITLYLYRNYLSGAIPE
jgi:Leucine-rich repeat (LRR) protein